MRTTRKAEGISTEGDLKGEERLQRVIFAVATATVTPPGAPLFIPLPRAYIIPMPGVCAGCTEALPVRALLGVADADVAHPVGLLSPPLCCSLLFTLGFNPQPRI